MLKFDVSKFFGRPSFFTSLLVRCGVSLQLFVVCFVLFSLLCLHFVLRSAHFSNTTKSSRVSWTSLYLVWTCSRLTYYKCVEGKSSSSIHILKWLVNGIYYKYFTRWYDACSVCFWKLFFVYNYVWQKQKQNFVNFHIIFSVRHQIRLRF